MAKKTTSTTVNAVDEFFEQLNAYFSDDDSMSIADVAAAAGISRQHLYEVKDRRSKPSYELVVKLTEIIGGEICLKFPKKACHV